MPRKPVDFRRRSAALAGAAERDLARLRQSLRAAEDHLAGLRRALKVPVPKGGRRSMPATRSALSIFERAGINSLAPLFAHDLLGEIGLRSGGFYASATQITAGWARLLQQAQRIM